jgi:hypothetical protein
MDHIDQFLVYAEEVSGLPRESLALYGGILAATIVVGQFVLKALLAEPIPKIEVEVTELEASDNIDTPIHVCTFYLCLLIPSVWIFATFVVGWPGSFPSAQRKQAPSHLAVLQSHCPVCVYFPGSKREACDG